MAQNDRTQPGDESSDFDLLDTLSHLLRRSHFHAEKLFSNAVGHHDVTSRQLALLVAVSKNPDISQRRVGELIALDMNTVSDMLRRMEKKGLVERNSPAEDGRTVTIRLSPQGVSMLDAVRADNRRYQELLTEQLSDAEAAQLKALLRQLLRLEQPRK